MHASLAARTAAFAEDSPGGSHTCGVIESTPTERQQHSRTRRNNIGPTIPEKIAELYILRRLERRIHQVRFALLIVAPLTIFERREVVDYDGPGALPFPGFLHAKRNGEAISPPHVRTVRKNFAFDNSSLKCGGRSPLRIQIGIRIDPFHAHTRVSPRCRDHQKGRQQANSPCHSSSSYLKSPRIRLPDPGNIIRPERLVPRHQR